MKKLKINAFADEANPGIDIQIKALKRNGIDGIEIRNADGENVSDISTEKAAEIKNKFDAEGLEIFSLGSPIGKINADEDFEPHLEKFRRTLETANILGAKNIRVFSFYIPKGCEAASFRNEVIDRLGQMCSLAKESGIDICHENEKGIYGDTPARCLEIFSALPDMRGIFDPANFVQCGEDTIRAWAMLKPYIKYLHIKDSLTDGRVVPAGMGNGNIPAILSEYIALGGKSVTLEPHLAVFDGLSALEREGEESAVGGMNYKSNEEAFDAACKALKKILEDI